MAATVAPLDARADVERRVLDIVTAFSAELGTLPARGAATREDALDRDLGLGSLERVELALRLEQAFGVQLGDAVVAEAERCGDLMRAVLLARPPIPEPPRARVAPVEAGIAAPSSTATLVEALRWHAERAADRVHIVLRAEDGGEERITYGVLWQRAVAMAGVLR